MTRGGAGDAAVSRAERHLASSVVSLRDRPLPIVPSVDPEAVALQRQLFFDTTLEVYRRLGIVGDDDAERWLRLARGEPEENLGAPIKAGAATAVIERLWRELPPERPTLTSGSPGQVPPWTRLAAALQALGLAGALSPDDVAAWQERLDAWVTGKSVSAMREARRRQAFAGSDLIHVAVGPGPYRAGIRICSVEIYSDGLVIRWQSEDALQPGAGHGSPVFGAEDDAGGEYTAAGGGAGGSGHGWRGRSVVAGAVSVGATRLTIIADDQTHAVDLSASGRAIT